MRRFLAKVVAAVTLGSAALVGGTVSPAGAEVIESVNYFGCDGYATNNDAFHYRLEEQTIREDDGGRHKKFFLSMFWQAQHGGGSYHPNAFHGWSSYPTYVTRVYHNAAGACAFEFGYWPGFSTIRSIGLTQDWQVGESTGGRWFHSEAPAGNFSYNWGDWAEWDNYVHKVIDGWYAYNSTEYRTAIIGY